MAYDKNYLLFHLHTELSLLDSCTNYKLYVDKAKEYGMKAICFSEHGNVYNWFEKKQYCEKNGLKYIHGCEVYLTEQLYWDKKIIDEKTGESKIIKTKERDNYHTVLIAKNLEGFKELNKLLKTSTDDNHTYYKNRITFDEFLNISDNIISTSACLQSPLNKLPRDNKYYMKLLNKYDYLEIQPHYNLKEQVEYNKYLIELSKRYNKKIIIGTDTHSLNKYKAECVGVLKKRKGFSYDNEDSCDLTMKSYDQVYDMFVKQGIEDEIILEGLNNTLNIINITEELVLDKSFKYPDLYEDEELLFEKESYSGLESKIKQNIIPLEKKDRYIKRIKEELTAYKKTKMCSFMLFMSELIRWCHKNSIPTSPSRGSCGGSEIAYLLDITDLDALEWDTIFSRFVNEYRVSLGDIDIDFPPDSRDKVYEYIINRFGDDKTCFILTTNTMADKGTIDNIVGGLYGDIKDKEKNKKSLELAKEIKDYYANNGLEKSKKKYPEVFYYFDGLLGTVESQGIHPAGIVASPITLSDNIGTHYYDGKIVSCINMEELHDLNYVKYDILGLKNVAIIRDVCKYINKPYPKSYCQDWKDRDVWDDIITSPHGIFQFEGSFAFDLLKKFRPQQINDLSLVNASLRPSGASYRDRLIAGEFNHNPSKELDDMLKDNRGFIVFQEDTLKFLMDICGFDGGRADNLRRAISNKDKATIETNIPDIIDGYHKHSGKSRIEAEKEVKQFIDILIDASSYQFGYNHSTGYSMLGYLCGYYRYYYPLEFICSILNNAEEMVDIVAGTELAKLKQIKILPPKFGYSKGKYMPNKDTNSIYKGIGSIKFLNNVVADELYELSQQNTYNSFFELLKDIKTNTCCNTKQLDILIKLSFFDCFGKTDKLLRIVDIYDNIYTKKQFKKEKLPKYLSIELVRKYANSETEKQFKDVDKDKLIEEIISKIPNKEIPINEILEAHLEYLGYIDYKNDKLPKKYVLITDINTKYTPVVDTYSLNSGVSIKCKINKKLWNNDGELYKNDVIYIHSMQKKFGYKKVGEKTLANGKVKPIFEEDQNKQEWWITNYSVIHNIDEVISEYEVDDEKRF